MDESQLQKKIILDQANEVDINTLLTKGKQLDLNPQQIELMQEMTQLAKQGSLLDETQKEEQVHDMYHSMFGIIESVGSWFDISSPKQLMESMGMT